MKKIVLSGVVIFAIIFGVLIFFNGEGGIGKKDSEKTYIGFIMNGAKDDGGYGQAHYEGIMALEDEMGVKVLCRENVPTDETCKDTINELIEEGCSIIFCTSFEYGVYEKEIAQQHPDLYFYHATGTDSSTNFASYFGRIYQMRYLAGMVAGLQTETDSIGYVAAFPISEVVRGINAFTLGVQRVNPEAVVHVEWTNSWTDGDAAADAAYRLINEQQIDVMTYHVNPFDQIDVAEKEGVYCIGYNMDDSSEYPNSYLTSCIWNWKVFYEEQVSACLEGKFKGAHYWEGSDTGIVDLAPFTKNVKPGIEEKVKEARKELDEGSVDVFYGPIYDQEGVLRIEEGESMSDDEMLNHFDWFVKGVDGSIE